MKLSVVLTLPQLLLRQRAQIVPHHLPEVLPAPPLHLDVEDVSPVITYNGVVPHSPVSKPDIAALRPDRYDISKKISEEGPQRPFRKSTVIVERERIHEIRHQGCPPYDLIKVHLPYSCYIFTPVLRYGEYALRNDDPLMHCLPPL